MSEEHDTCIVQLGPGTVADGPVGKHTHLQRTKTSSLRGQAVHFVNCKRILQQAKMSVVAEFTALQLFLDLPCCLVFHGQLAKDMQIV